MSRSMQKMRHWEAASRNWNEIYEYLAKRIGETVTDSGNPNPVRDVNPQRDSDDNDADISSYKRHGISIIINFGTITAGSSLSIYEFLHLRLDKYKVPATIRAFRMFHQDKRPGHDRDYQFGLPPTKRPIDFIPSQIDHPPESSTLMLAEKGLFEPKMISIFNGSTKSFLRITRLRTSGFSVKIASRRPWKHFQKLSAFNIQHLNDRSTVIRLHADPNFALKFDASTKTIVVDRLPENVPSSFLFRLKLV